MQLCSYFLVLAAWPKKLLARTINIMNRDMTLEEHTEHML